jgi:preprotein translocase subunit SecE
LTSNTLPNQPANTADMVKFVAAGVLVAASLFAYYWFEQAWPQGVRILVVVAALAVAGWLFLKTMKGGQVREFLSEARFELRKVVWPTRQEATKTMWVVVIAVIIISLILAAFDWVIQLAVKALLGS